MKTVFLQVLFVLRMLCVVTLAGAQPKAPLKCSTECRSFTSEIAAKRIRSYRRTEPQCTKQAIIFITLKSLEMCADPEEEWVEKIVKKLDEKKAAASPLPHGAASAVAPEEPGVFQKHVGLTATAPSQATAPTNFFQGTGTTVLERIHVPAAGMEASSKSPPVTQDTTQLHAGPSPVMWEVAAHSEVAPEANRESLKSPSKTFGAGMVSSQPTPYPTSLAHGFDSAVGSTEGPVGHTANATAGVRVMTSPSSNSDPMAITKGSDRPVLPTNESLDPTSATANAPDAAPNSFSSDLPSILGSMEIAIIPASPVPPKNTSVSTPNSTNATDKGPSVHTDKVVGSFADAFGTRTFDYSLLAGKQEPSDTLVFTSQAFSRQAGEQVTKERPNDQPLPTFLSRSQMLFVIPVSVVGGLLACSIAVVWLYLKSGVKRGEMSREMVQGLLYQKEGHQKDVYLMEVI
ncbi:fractalkine isoform X1 [Grus americana]|uniref:fractalkine isoform X1 n=2 Tax=Grus americana TaxID=9117 RepID=UPI002408902F|nr:fractalkine isoform X1 [Grus americana]